MLPFVGIYIEYSQIYDDPIPSLDDIQTYFSQLPTSYLIQLFCKINISLWRTEGNLQHAKDLQVHLINLLFSKEEVEKIHNYLSETKEKSWIVAFHRHQMLLAIKTILLGGINHKQDEVNTHDLGKYLLALSQYLQPKNTSWENIIDTIDFEYARQAIARLGYFSHNGIFIMNFARALYTWLEIPKSNRGKTILSEVSFDLEKEFLEETGITIEAFITKSFLNLGKLFVLDIKTDNPYDFMLNSNYLSLPTITEKEKTSLYQLLSQNLVEFKQNYEKSIQEKLNGIDIYLSNFLPLVDKPILKLNNDLFVVSDPQYLEEKIASGPYWILLNRFLRIEGRASKKANELSKLYGRLHQEYVYQSLVSLCDEVIEVNEKNYTDKKTCDFIGIIRKDKNVVLFLAEAKKIALKLPMTFLSDKKISLENLERVFGNKGFEQIYSTIEIIKKGELEEMKTIDGDIIAIFPLLLTDRFIVEESLNRNFYEKEFFDKLVKKYTFDKSLNIQRPIFMSSEELDLLEGKALKEGKIHFADFLSFRISELNKRFFRAQKQFIPNMEIESIGYIVDHLDTIWNTLYLLRFQKYENTRLKKISDKEMDKLRQELFPKDK